MSFLPPEVLMAHLFSGSIDDVLGDLLGDDSKYSFPGQSMGDWQEGSASEGVSLTTGAPPPGPTWGRRDQLPQTAEVFAGPCGLFPQQPYI